MPPLRRRRRPLQLRLPPLRLPLRPRAPRAAARPARPWLKFGRAETLAPPIVFAILTLLRSNLPFLMMASIISLLVLLILVRLRILFVILLVRIRILTLIVI